MSLKKMPFLFIQVLAFVVGEPLNEIDSFFCLNRDIWIFLQKDETFVGAEP